MTRLNCRRGALLFIALFSCTISNVLAENRPSEAAAQYAGKGLASEIVLTEQEQAWLDRRLAVRVRVADAPPYHMSSPGPRGISVDYLTLIGKRFGINFSFVKTGSTTWQEAIDDLTGERKMFDLLITMMRTEAREKTIAFTQNYLFSPWVIVNRTDSDFVAKIQDLNGKKVAVENGFVIRGLLEKDYPQIRIVACNTSLDALQSVASGGSDAYIANLTIASYLIQKNGLNNLKIAAPTPFGSHDQSMGVRKDWPELASIISKALMAMSEAEKSELDNRWLSIRYDHGVNLTKLLIWVAGVITVFSLVIALVFIWNRRLRREVNNRILAEEALQKSQNLLNQAEKLGRVGGWEFDIETGQQTWTETVYDIYELDSTAQPTVQQGVNFYTPASRPLIERAVQRAIEQGEPFDLELEIITAKGNLRSVHAVGQADRVQHKITGFFQDITARKQAEQALQASEASFRAVAELSPMAIYASTGSEQKGVYANEAFYKLFGFSMEEVPTVGHWWTKAFPDEKYRQQVIDQWTYNIEQANKNNTNVEALECVCTCKDGSEKVIAWVGQTIGDEFWAFGYDLSASKRAEEALRQSRQAALKLMQDAVEARNQAELMSATLKEQLDELRRWQQATLGREGRILAMKKEVNELLAAHGQPPRYASAVAGERDT